MCSIASPIATTPASSSSSSSNHPFITPSSSPGPLPDASLIDASQFDPHHIESNIKVNGVDELMRHVIKSSPSSSSTSTDPSQRPLRIWADGCFDLMHFGHSNALRQAKYFTPSLASNPPRPIVLVVGVHSDAEISRHKGPPVMKENERYAHVLSCKWVDEVVENAPYVTMAAVLKQFNIDFCVHGEDTSYDEFGNDSYKEVKDAGLYQTIKRTEGVSTTEIVGRMLKRKKDIEAAATAAASEEGLKKITPGQIYDPSSGGISQFLTSSRLITYFNTPHRPPPPPPASIVYIDGTFDLFHISDILTLYRAKKKGDYLIVGIWDDENVRRKNAKERKIAEKLKGENIIVQNDGISLSTFSNNNNNNDDNNTNNDIIDCSDYNESDLPILSMYERALCVLSCGFVDEIILSAPIKPSTQQLLQIGATRVLGDSDDEERFISAKQLGIYRLFKHTRVLTDKLIIERIFDNLSLYENRNKKKAKGQDAIHKQQREEYEKKLAMAKRTSNADE